MKFLKTYENFWDVYVPSGNYLDMEILENGDLKISLTDEGKEEVEDNGIDFYKFYDLFDDIRGNSDFMFFEDLSDAGLVMTNAPGITDGYYFDDNGDITDKEHDDSVIYWYPNYVISDFTEVLKEKGYVIFNTISPKTKEEIEERKFQLNTKKYNL